MRRGDPPAPTTPRCRPRSCFARAGGPPPLTAISDAPRASALNYFNLVISPRGVRSDSTWAILESALAESVLPRALERDDVYQVLMAAMRQSPDLPLAR